MWLFCVLGVFCSVVGFGEECESVSFVYGLYELFDLVVG